MSFLISNEWNKQLYTKVLNQSEVKFDRLHQARRFMSFSFADGALGNDGMAEGTARSSVLAREWISRQSSIGQVSCHGFRGFTHNP